jgi:hypothetical protein
VSPGCCVKQTHVHKHIRQAAEEAVIVRSILLAGKWDKNLEQRINNNFCVKIGKSASETLAILTLAYGKYAMKKMSVF